MITKEVDDLDTYCIYANDFHLEMILLPYIKENLQMKKFIILTENNLESSIRILLDRTNLSDENKEKIYNLNWNNNIKEKISYIKNYKNNNEDFTIIIKGNFDFINNIINQISSVDSSNINININIIRCYSIEEVEQRNIKLDEANFLKTGRI